MKNLIMILSLFLACNAFAGQGMGPGPGLGIEASTPSGPTTYGATTSGALGRFEGATDAYARKIVLDSSGTLTKIGGYFSSTSGIGRGVKLALYTDNSGTPGTQVAAEIELTVSASASDEQVESAYHNTVISAGTYWIGFVSSYGQTGATYDSGVAGDRPRATPGTVYDLETNWADMTAGSTSTQKLALYIVVEH